MDVFSGSLSHDIGSFVAWRLSALVGCRLILVPKAVSYDENRHLELQWSTETKACRSRSFASRYFGGARPALSTPVYREWAGAYLWVGESKNRGIGIFPRNGHRVEALNWYGSFSMPGLFSHSEALNWNTKDLRLFLPFIVNEELTVLGIWTKGRNEEVFGYIGQLWKYLQIHRKELSGPKTIILGDFNSNVRWDRPDRWWNHSDVAAELSEMGFQSQYHRVFEEEQGKETQPTFFLHRNRLKPHHIDYVFTSADMSEGCTLQVGQCDDWISISDHVPLTLSISSESSMSQA